MTFIEFGIYYEVERGDWVLAAGNPGLALENDASVAMMMLTIACVIAKKRVKEKEEVIIPAMA